MSFIKTIRLGCRYLELWPNHPLLTPVFAENRVKRAMLLGQKLLPPFIVLILVWAYYRGGGFHGVEFMFAMKNTWPMTLMCVLFLLLMPVQGYYWLGKRAQTKLNKKQALFYVELCKKLTNVPVLEPTMMDLALRITDGIAVLGPDFLKNL